MELSLTQDERASRAVDRLGIVLAAAGTAATVFMPFIIVKANRIAAGKPMLLTQLAGQPAALALIFLLVVVALTALFLHNARGRLVIATLALGLLILTIGLTSTAATPPNSAAARITPGGAFWALL